MVKLEIRFHGYKTRIKSFQVIKTLSKFVFYTKATPLLLTAAVLTPASPPRWNPPCRGEGAYH